MTTECQIIIFCLDPQLRVIPQNRYLGRRDRQEIARVAHLIIACNSLISYAILYEYYETQVVPLVVFVIPSVAVPVGEKDGYAAHALLLAFVVVSRACVVYALAPAARRTAPTSTVAACHHRASLAAARRASAGRASSRLRCCSLARSSAMQWHAATRSHSYKSLLRASAAR
jgi:hypothetical protein